MNSILPQGALRWIGVALLFATTLVPVILLQEVAYPFVVPRAAWLRVVAAGLTAALALLVVRHEVRLHLRSDPFAIALVLYVAIAALTAIPGVSLTHSLYGDLSRMGGVLTWAAYVVVYLSVGVLLTSGEQIQLLRFSVLLGAGVGGLALVQAIKGLPVKGLQGNAAYVGIYCLVTLTASLYLLQGQEKGAFWRGLLSLGGALCFAGVVVSGERGPLLGLGLALVAAVVIALPGESRAPGRLRVLGLAILLLIALLSAIRGTESIERFPRVARVVNTSSVDGGVAFRLLMWQTGLKQAARQPIAGIGMENFIVAFNQRFPSEIYRKYPGEANVDRAHNAYLEALVAAGVPGLLAFSGLWLAALWGLYRGYRAGRIDRTELGLLSGGILGYAAYLFFWFDDHSSMVALVVLLGVAMSRACGPLIELGEKRPLNLPRRVSVGAAIGLIALVAVRHAALPAVAAVRVAPALSAEALPLETRLEAYRAAAAVGAPEAQEVILSYAEFLEAQRGAMPALRTDPHRRPLVNTALQDAIARVDQHQAWDPHNDAWWRARSGVLSSAAVFYQDARYHQLALRDIGRAIEISPTRTGHWYHLSNLRLLGGDAAGAYAALEHARRLDPLHGGTYYRMGRMFALLGRTDDARRMLLRSWELGYFAPDRNFVVDVVQALGAEGRPREAGEMAERYLSARYAGEKRPQLQDTADARVTAAGVDMLRAAGEADRAAALGRRWVELTRDGVRR